jgi:hypothetical protein
MVARFRASWPHHAERQDCAPAGAEEQPRGQDLDPFRRCPLRDGSLHNIDDDPLGSVVSHVDPSRAGRDDYEPCGRDGERDASAVGARPAPLSGRGGRRQHKRGEDREREGRPHRAIAVNVTVAV